MTKVRLNRITTKTGDDGSTSLGDGSRVCKTHLRIAAIGSIDELNAAIGLAVAVGDVPDEMAGCLRHVQHDLFDAGAELCVPPTVSSETASLNRLGVTPPYVARLEEQVERVVDQLEPLDSFVLPGGTLLAAHLHVSRTICRRAERDVLLLAETDAVGMELRQYLNRLSDLLFLFARLANNGGRGDVLWQPGRD